MRGNSSTVPKTESAKSIFKKVITNMKTIAYIIAAAIAATTVARITTSFWTSELILADRTAEGYGWVEIAQSRVITDFELDLIQLIAQHPEQIRTELYLSAVGSILAQAGAETKPQTRLQILDSDTGIWFSDPRAMGLGHSGRKNGVEWEATPAEILQEMLSDGRQDTVNTILGTSEFGYTSNYISIARAAKAPSKTQIAYIGALQYDGPTGYTLFLPDGRTPFPTNWNLITAEINGIQQVKLNRDGTYTTAFGTIRNLGGGFSAHAEAGLIFTQSAPDGRLMIYQPQTGWKTIEQRTATALALQAGPAIETDKRQIFHGESVVVEWTEAARIDIIDPLGNTVEYYTAPLGAIAFAPIGTGMYHVVLTDAEGVVQTREVNVLPNPAPNAWVGIEASTATAAIGEAYSVGWNSTGGGVAIVRVTPGRDANSPDGVFHNATSGHAVFVNHAPGRYCYSIQMGQAYHQVVVEVTGEPTLPGTPPAKK